METGSATRIPTTPTDFNLPGTALRRPRCLRRARRPSTFTAGREDWRRGHGGAGERLEILTAVVRPSCGPNMAGLTDAPPRVGGPALSGPAPLLRPRPLPVPTRNSFSLGPSLSPLAGQVTACPVFFTPTSLWGSALPPIPPISVLFVYVATLGPV